MPKKLTLDQADFEHIEIDRRENGLVVLTLRRSDRDDPLNTIDDVLHRELFDLPEALQHDRDVRAAILTGAGANFSAGADISGGRKVSGIRDSQYELHMVEALGIVNRFLQLDKPVITVVRGYCLGLGCTVALLGDIVVAGESAKFGDPHVWNVGVTAGDGNAALWPLLVGPQRAKYYLMTGEFLPAADALQFGLVHKVLPDDEVGAEAERIGARLAAGPPLAIRSTKASVQRYMRMVVDTVIPFSLAVEGFVAFSDDPKEARAAWVEKRAPNFTGMDDMARAQASARAGQQDQDYFASKRKDETS